MISRQQALELMEVRGGDKARLVFLCETLGVKLVGRRGLGGQGDSLVSAIKWGRTARKPVISPSILNGGANVKLPKPQVIPEESLQSR
jgi:lysine-specific histone demethylase 1